MVTEDRITADGAVRAVDPVQLYLTQALDAHLRSGALRGPLFEQSLLNAINASVLCSDGASQPAQPQRAAMSCRTLRMVQDFIQANLARQFSVDDIARAACLSSYHLGRTFHQTTGHSLWQYVLQCRAALARGLIAGRPGLPLADIAVQSGFESYSQFIAAFRKAHGVSPGEYRRNLH